MNIVDVIRGETSNYLDKSAIIDGNNQISYAELFAAIDGLAAELKACGIRPAQRVALLCGDSIDYIVINLAVLSISAVIVPVFPSSSRDEINTIIEKMSINYLISERPIHFQDNTKQILFNYTGKKEFFLYHRLLGEQISAEYYTINPAFIRFSSGTTGINKGVVLSHESIIQRTDAANKGLKITSEDIIIWILSMTFHFVVTIFLFLRRAATIVLCSSEFPQALIDGLKRCKATFIYASPFHYYMLSHTDVFRPDLLSGVRIAVSTATNLPNDNAGDFYEKFGFELSQAYGIIEVGLPFINCSADKTKRGSVGRILPDYEIKIVNPDAEGIGEIRLRGKGMFSAYFWPWQSRDNLSQDGWFSTGDLGRLDKDDYLFLVGRTNSLINYCGMKIFPYEVEAVLNQHPAIKESLVFGIPHPQYGQLPGAKIILENTAEEKFDSNDLRKFCYQHLASYKVPKEFYTVSCLAKTTSGKLKRGSSF